MNREDMVLERELDDEIEVEVQEPTWRPEIEVELADLIWDLLVPPVASPNGQRGIVEPGGQELRYGRKFEFTKGDLLAHVRGEIYLATRAVQEGNAVWIAVDIDSTVPDELREVRERFCRASIPFYVNFSGRKGYHFNIFLSRPVNEAEYRELCYLVDGALQGISWKDKITRGQQVMSVPCGRHPVTHRLTGFIDDETGEILDLDQQITLLQSVERWDVSKHLRTPQGTSSVPATSAEPPLDRLHSTLGCVEVLYRQGLQAQHTRHSATLAIKEAIRRRTDIPEKAKLGYIKEWVRRTYPSWIEKGFVDPKSTLEFSLEEAERLYRIDGAQYAISCHVDTYKAALKSACTPEMQARCALLTANRQGEKPKWATVLRTAGVWKGARACGDVYDALAERAALSNETYEGMPKVTMSLAIIAEAAGVSMTSARTSIARLIELGLMSKVPGQVLTGRGASRGRPPGVFAVPQLDEAKLVEVIRRARELGGERSTL